MISVSSYPLAPRVPAAAIVVLLIAGCATGGTSGGGTGSASTGTTAASGTAQAASTASSPSTPGYQPVADMPIPSGTKINTERSLILGSPDRWFGRMVLALDRSSTLAYAYYVDQMPTFGWENLAATQGKTSTLTYVRGDRTSFVEISSAALRGSEVVITVTPKPAAAPAAGPTSGNRK